MRVCRHRHVSTGTARAVFCLSPLDLRCQSHGLGGSQSSTLFLTVLRLGVRGPGAGPGRGGPPLGHSLLLGPHMPGLGQGSLQPFVIIRVLVPFTRALLTSPLKGSSS